MKTRGKSGLQGASQSSEKPAIPRAFECNVRGTNWQRTIYALSAGKAKSEYWRDVREAWDTPFTAITCRSLHTPPPTPERFLSVADSRGLPFARIGMRVEVEGEPGVLVGANDSANFDVFFTAGKLQGQTGNCHPHYEMKYFGQDGTVLADFTRSQEVSCQQQ